jgi:hypothetical protein
VAERGKRETTSSELDHSRSARHRHPEAEYALLLDDVEISGPLAALFLRLSAPEPGYRRLLLNAADCLRSALGMMYETGPIALAMPLAPPQTASTSTVRRLHCLIRLSDYFRMKLLGAGSCGNLGASEDTLPARLSVRHLGVFTRDPAPRGVVIGSRYLRLATGSSGRLYGLIRAREIAVRAALFDPTHLRSKVGGPQVMRLHQPTFTALVLRARPVVGYPSAAAGGISSQHCGCRSLVQVTICFPGFQ